MANTTNVQNGGVGKQFQMELSTKCRSSPAVSKPNSAEHWADQRGSQGLQRMHAPLTYYTHQRAGRHHRRRTLQKPRHSQQQSPVSVRCCWQLLSDGAPEYFNAKKDQSHRGTRLHTRAAVEEQAWLPSSYIPASVPRAVLRILTSANPGPRILNSTQTNQNAYNR